MDPNTPRPGPVAGLHQSLWFVLLFATLYSVAYVSLQLPFASLERFLMEKDQMDLLHQALIGRSEGYSIGSTDVRTLPVLQYGYTFFFQISRSLLALFWTLAGLKLAALLGFWLILRRHLAPFLGELMALVFLFDAHRHWDYWSTFLPNTHSEPLILLVLALLALFHWRGRWAYLHAANVTVCLLLNFHFINAVLLLLPAAVAWKNRDRFDLRSIRFFLLPYAILGLLFLPQLGGLQSLMDPITGATVAPKPPSTIWVSAATFFADQSSLGLLGLFGIGFVARRAWSAKSSSGFLDGLAVATTAALAGLAIAYALVGDILVSEATYRLRAFMPAVILTHFLVLDEVVRWARSPRGKGALLVMALFLTPLHAVERTAAESGQGPFLPRISATEPLGTYAVAGGVRLGRALVEALDAPTEALGQIIHLIPIEREMQFFVEAARRDSPSSPSREPEGKAYQVVELRSPDLVARFHSVEPCLHFPEDLVLEAAPGEQPPSNIRIVDCPDSPPGPRYLYVLLRPGSPAIESIRIGSTRFAMVAPPELDYPIWNEAQILRTAEPVELSLFQDEDLEVVDPRMSAPLQVFESPVLLRDHQPLPPLP